MQVGGDFLTFGVPDAGGPFLAQCPPQSHPQRHRQHHHTGQRHPDGQQRRRQSAHVGITDQNDDGQSADDRRRAAGKPRPRAPGTAAGDGCVELPPHHPGADEHHQERQQVGQRRAGRGDADEKRHDHAHQSEPVGLPTFGGRGPVGVVADRAQEPQQHICGHTGTGEGAEQNEHHPDTEHVDVQVIGQTPGHPTDDPATVAPEHFRGTTGVAFRRRTGGYGDRLRSDAAGRPRSDAAGRPRSDAAGRPRSDAAGLLRSRDTGRPGRSRWLGPDGAPCTISAANHIFDTGTIGLPGTSGTISGCYPIPAIARRRQY